MTTQDDIDAAAPDRLARQLRSVLEPGPRVTGQAEVIGSEGRCVLRLSSRLLVSCHAGADDDQVVAPRHRTVPSFPASAVRSCSIVGAPAGPSGVR